MKRKKYVKESLNERWVSSDTGYDRYFSAPEQPKTTNASKYSIKELKQLVPSKNSIHFTESDFDAYVDDIINVIMPDSPSAALTVLKLVLQEHPYLTKRQIGFKGTNPYGPSLEKFMNTLKMVKQNKTI